MHELTEPTLIADTLCSGIGAIEDMGAGNLRFWLYVLQIADGHQEKIVVAKLVVPAARVPEEALRMAKASGIPIMKPTAELGGEAMH